MGSQRAEGARREVRLELGRSRAQAGAEEKGWEGGEGREAGEAGVMCEDTAGPS